LCPFQDQDQQGGNHIDAGYDDHYADDKGYVKIKKPYPFKDLVVLIGDILSIQVRKRFAVYLRSLSFQGVKILQKHFKGTYLVIRPLIHVLDMPQVDKEVGSVELLKATVEEASYSKLSLVGGFGRVVVL